MVPNGSSQRRHTARQPLHAYEQCDTARKFLLRPSSAVPRTQHANSKARSFPANVSPGARLARVVRCGACRWSVWRRPAAPVPQRTRAAARRRCTCRTSRRQTRLRPAAAHLDVQLHGGACSDVICTHLEQPERHAAGRIISATQNYCADAGTAVVAAACRAGSVHRCAHFTVIELHTILNLLLNIR